MLTATKLKKHCLGGVALALLALPLNVSLIAQEAPASLDTPATAATIEAKGVVRTGGGVPVPGATLLLTNTATAGAFVSWTDENGQFDLPGLPPGHYRIQVTQLGFEDATSEADFGPGATAPVQVSMKVASLEAIEKSAQPAVASAQSATAAGASAPLAQSAPSGGESGVNRAGEIARRRGFGQGGGGAAGAGATGGPAGPGGFRRNPCFQAGANGGQGQGPGGNAPNAQAQGAGGNQPSATGSQGGQGQAQNCGQFAGRPGAARFGGAAGASPRGGFQQLGLNGNGRAGGEAANAEQQEAEGEAGVEGAAPAADQGPLGQAAGADAVLLNGTVGQGVADVAPQDGGGGPGPGGPGGPGGGFAPGGGFGAGTPAFAGQGGVAAGTAGGFAGGGGGAPGLNLRVAGNARGGRGGATGRPQGVPALFGLQRVLRQRANRIRFSFYDQYSNSVFNAKPFTLTQIDPPKIPTWSETTGGNLGGPLIIPHLYDGSDKTFFFINFESAWTRSAVDEFSTVPTAFERANPGDFCDVPGLQIYVPTNPSSPFGSRTLANNGGCQIPTSMINTTALQLLQFFPQPNVPNTGLADNYHLQTSEPTQNTRINTRVLQTISPQLNARVIYNFSQAATHAFQSFPSLESNSGTRGQSATLGLTENFNRSWINDSQLIYSRNRVLNLNSFANVDNVSANLGITGISSAPIDFGLPQLSFTNYSGLSDAAPSLTRNQTYRFVDSVTNLRAKHTLTMGAEIRRIENNTFTDASPEGQFSFSSLMTAQLDSNGNPVTPAAGALNGYDFASFLLGLPSATNVRFGTPSSYFRSWAFIGYFTDDWRVRPNFTLEYGVRYEAFTPPSELCGHLSNLSLNSTFTEASVVVPTQNSSCDTPLPTSTTVLQNSSLIHGNYDHFSPRLGIAWRPPLKAFEGKYATTIRAGYGMFYNESVYSQLTTELANQNPWANSQMLVSQPCQPLTITNIPSTSCSATTSTVLPNTYAIDPNYKVGYAQIWNLSTETNLFTNTTISFTYTGTKGTHLDELLALNRPLPGESSLTPQVANAGDFIYDTSGASSIFNALQVRLQQRTTHGIGFNVIYTYGKSTDDASSIGGGGAVVEQNAGDPQADWGLSSFDVRQQLRTTYFYEIPLGDRHRFAQKGISADLFGNWRFSGNVTAQTGTPFTATETGALGNTGGGGSFSTRPDEICNPNLPASQRTPLDFFNTACFVAAPSGEFGNAPRNSIEGPGSFTWNLQMAKWIPFGKDQTHRVDIRWEITNLTNTPRWSGLSTVVGSTTFGRVTAVTGNRTMDIVLRVNW